MIDNPYQSPTPSQTAKAPVSRAALLISCLGTFVLVAAAMHVRSDRSRSRQPIISYAGPLSSWMPELIYIGLGLSILGFLLGAFIAIRSQDNSALTSASVTAMIAVGVSAANVLGAFIAYCGIMEDWQFWGGCCVLQGQRDDFRAPIGLPWLWFGVLAITIAIVVGALLGRTIGRLTSRSRPSDGQ